MKIVARFTAMVAAALVLGAGCAQMRMSDAQGSPAALPPIIDPAPRDGVPVVLIAMPLARDFVEVRQGLVPELARSFNIVTFIVAPGTKAAEMGAVIAQHKPACLVVMNNATVGLLMELQRTSKGQPTPPAVVVMTSFLEGLRPLVKNTTGIAYEVPGVTSFINLRALMTKPLTRIGVAYRPIFRDFVSRQRKMAAREQIELVAVEVPKDASASDLRTALLGVAATQVDAFWMLNDNGLIKSQSFMESTWRAALRDARVPLIVGAANLIVPRAALGTFAAVPDYEALGLQAANLVFDLSENDWRADEHAIEMPLSVKTIIDLPQLRDRFGLREEGLRHVDIAKE
jgi:hypothetical protein